MVAADAVAEEPVPEPEEEVTAEPVEDDPHARLDEHLAAEQDREEDR